LLRLMLDSHPSFAIPPESHFIPKLARAYGMGAVDSGAVAREVVATQTFAAWGLDPRAVLEGASGSTLGEVVASIFVAYAEAHGKSRWGDKTPAYVLEMPVLSRLFDGSRFVHIIRDGRDVALSLRSVRFGPNDPMGAAAFWERRVRTGMHDGTVLGPERYREIRYESLIAEPEKELRELAPWLDLEYSPAMLGYPEHVDEALRDHRRVQHEHESKPPAAGVRDWRTQMSSEDVAAFEAVAGDLLDELGYERGASRPGAGLRARAALVRARARRHRRMTSE